MKNEKTNIDFLKGDKENPFKVPDGYFEKSRASILDSIAKEKSEPVSKIISLRQRIMWVSGIAATLLIGLLLFQNLVYNPTRENRLAQEIDWFIDYSGSDLDMGTLTAYMVDEGLSMDNSESDYIDDERSYLLDMTDYDELLIIEEWMETEK